MANKIESLRGMDDILPGEVEKWQWLEEKTRIFFKRYFFDEIRTPILEYTELFKRSVGESSDIVHKEMFSFEDRGGRNVTLRPEMTASVARAVIEKGLLSQAKSLSLYYIGPMFRAERPQAGRKRQFHQIGVEVINEESVFDVDTVYVLCDFLKEVGLNEFELKINDLGTVEQQQETAQKLKVYFEESKSDLCKDCSYRLEKNVLRILDCKNPACQPVIDKAPWEKIGPPPSDSFKQTIDMLVTEKIPFKINHRLVRGLDYYNGLVFEVTAKGLGAQDALAGGGRYDRLYSALGGKPTPCIGFSIGMERLLLALGDIATAKARENLIYFAPLEMEDQNDVLKAGEKLEQAANELGQVGMQPIVANFQKKLESHLKAANRCGAKYVVILGADEVKNQMWTLKDMDKKTQEKVKWGSLFSKLKQVNV